MQIDRDSETNWLFLLKLRLMMNQMIWLHIEYRFYGKGYQYLFAYLQNEIPHWHKMILRIDNSSVMQVIFKKLNLDLRFNYLSVACIYRYVHHIK